MQYNYKKIFLAIIIFSTLSGNSLHAHQITYKSKIETDTAIGEINTVDNIQKAKLLEDYVLSLEKEIKKITTDHYIKSEELKSRSFTLRVIAESLKKVQTYSIEKHHADDVMQSSIGELRTLKQEIKALLKKELKNSQSSFNALKEKRSKQSKEISKRFISFVNIFTPKVRQLSNTKKRKLILSSLTNINIEASKLALFEGNNFSSPKELEDYYFNRIRAIKREIFTIKAIISD